MGEERRRGVAGEVTIDWDGIASEAEKTPAALLADFLAEAEGLTAIAIVALRKVPDLASTESIRCEVTGGAFTALGMLEYGKRWLLETMDEGN